MQETSLTPLIWLLIPLVGVAVTVPLVITEHYNQIWQAWVLPQNTLVLPLYIYMWWKRRTGLRRAVREWNRSGSH